MTRLAFFGSPDVSARVLEALIADGHDIAIVVTRADKRRGRAIASAPVAEVAEKHNLMISHQPNDAVDVGAELGIVVAYGAMLREPLLSELQMLNVHYSLLPRWRGAAPVERAILAGDSETGSCIMEIAAELDAGRIYATRRLPIDDEITSTKLRAQLTDIGIEQLRLLLSAPLPEPKPQVGEPTYAEKLSHDEFRLDWNRPAIELHRMVRVERAWTTFRDEPFRIWSARIVERPEGEVGQLIQDTVVTGDGGLQLLEVQPASKSRMDFKTWRNGARLDGTERFV